MRAADLVSLSALEQAALVRSGAVSSEELTRVYLDRIARLDGELHAFVEVMAERALRAARRADARGAPDNLPLFGVPVAIKDANAVRGTFMRFGSRAFAGFFTPFDDAVVAQLRRAGLIIVGKTATSELGILPLTEPDTHPPTRNPWDLEVTPGGSSGGAASAVAARMVPFAQGSDGGGSVRIPASFCGLVGFKPSRGVVPNPFGFDQPDILWTCGPLARSVDDAAALLDAMIPRQPSVPGFLARLRSEPRAEATRRPLFVRFATDVDVVETSPDARAAVERAAKILSAWGHEVEPGPTEVKLAIEDFLPIWQETVASIPVADWTLTEPLTRWLAETGKELRREDVARTRAFIASRVLARFGDADLWVTPTVAMEPIRVGSMRDLPPAELFRRAAEFGVFTAPFNVSGQPAISIPVALSRHGHPIGVQLTGRHGGDLLVLSVARRLENELAFSEVAPLAK
jgi:amidase